MSLDHNSASSAEPAGYDHLRARWGEHIVTVVAASLGVLIVALIAVLMGMA